MPQQVTARGHRLPIARATVPVHSGSMTELRSRLSAPDGNCTVMADAALRLNGAIENSSVGNQSLCSCFDDLRTDRAMERQRDTALPDEVCRRPTRSVYSRASEASYYPLCYNTG